jgi:hypothetical protein
MSYEYDMLDMRIRTGYISNNKHYIFDSEYHTCREILLDEIQQLLPDCQILFNSRKNIPCIIYTNPQNFRTIEYYQDPENIKLLEELILNTVGIISICLYHDKLDNEWRQNKHFSTSIVSKDDEMIIKLLPPSFLCNPISASLMLGLIRDMINLIKMRNKASKNFLRKMSNDTTLSCIKTSNYQLARAIYLFKIEPFLSSISNIDENIVVNKNSLPILRELITSGFRYFYPEMTRMYWHLTRDNVGYTTYWKCMMGE